MLSFREAQVTELFECPLFTSKTVLDVRVIKKTFNLGKYKIITTTIIIIVVVVVVS